MVAPTTDRIDQEGAAVNWLLKAGEAALQGLDTAAALAASPAVSGLLTLHAAAYVAELKDLQDAVVEACGTPGDGLGELALPQALAEDVRGKDDAILAACIDYEEAFMAASRRALEFAALPVAAVGIIERGIEAASRRAQAAAELRAGLAPDAH